MGTRHWPEDADEEVARLEAKLAEMQAEFNKARELLSESREDVVNSLNEYLNNPHWNGAKRGAEFCEKQLAEIDAFLKG